MGDLAADHSIDDYYERSIWPIRMIERRRLAIIREFVGDAGGLRILDIGSGGGHVLRMFPTAKLTAVDVSPRFLDIARRNLAGYDVDFRLGEVDRLDLPEASFDRVICTEVLEHVPDPERILATAARLLAPGGRAVITVPNDPLIVGLKRLVRLTPIGWWLRDRIEWGGDRYHLHRWTPAEFATLLERFFVVIERRFAPIDSVPIRACFLCGVAAAHRATFRCFGLGESDIQSALRPIGAKHAGVRFTFRVTFPEIGVTLAAPDAQALEAATRDVRSALGRVVYAEEEIGLPEALGRALIDRGLTLAAAESCTGGLIGHAMTEVPGSSRYFLGSAVCYSNEAKVELLGVDRAVIEKHGAVSEEVARAMAEGARGVFGADIGLGVTGIAGPEGGTSEKPVGLVHMAVAHSGGCEHHARVLGGLDRSRVKRLAAWTVMSAALRRARGVAGAW